MYPNAFYRVSAKALIKDSTGRVLVIKENQDTWSLPGGGVDHGESPEVALRRELAEEIGARSVNIQGFSKTLTFELLTKHAWLLWIVYDVDIESAPLRLGSDVAEACYIDVDMLKESTDIFERMVAAATAPRHL